MSTPTHTAQPPTARATARLAGWLYLVTFASSIPAVGLLAPILNDPAYILGSGSDTSVMLGALLDMINAAACIGTAVVLYRVARRQSAAAALGFVTARVMEAAIIMIGVVALVAAVTMRQDLADAAGTDPAALQAVGTSLVEMRNATFLLGPSLIPGINALLLGTVMYRSGLVPRIIPTMGLIGGPLIIASVVTTMLGINHEGSVFAVAATVPIFLWELTLGAWMAFKGFRDTPITAAIDAKAAQRV